MTCLKLLLAVALIFKVRAKQWRMWKDYFCSNLFFHV